MQFCQSPQADFRLVEMFSISRIDYLWRFVYFRFGEGNAARINLVITRYFLDSLWIYGSSLIERQDFFHGKVLNICWIFVLASPLHLNLRSWAFHRSQEFSRKSKSKIWWNFSFLTRDDVSNGNGTLAVDSFSLVALKSRENAWSKCGMVQYMVHTIEWSLIGELIEEDWMSHLGAGSECLIADNTRSSSDEDDTQRETSSHAKRGK